MPELVLNKSNQVLKAIVAVLEWSSARLISYNQQTVLYYTTYFLLPLVLT